MFCNCWWPEVKLNHKHVFKILSIPVIFFPFKLLQIYFEEANRTAILLQLLIKYLRCFTYPRADEIHSLSVRAFNMVSAVVKVFDTTTTTKIRRIANSQPYKTQDGPQFLKSSMKGNKKSSNELFTKGCFRI